MDNSAIGITYGDRLIGWGAVWIEKLYINTGLIGGRCIVDATGFDGGGEAELAYGIGTKGFECRLNGFVMRLNRIGVVRACQFGRPASAAA